MLTVISNEWQVLIDDQEKLTGFTLTAQLVNGKKKTTLSQASRGEPLGSKRVLDSVDLHNSRRTFDRDTDCVVDSAERVLGSAAVISSVRVGHIVDAQRLLEVQERRPLGRQLAAHLGPGHLRGWPGFRKEGRDVTLSDGGGEGQHGASSHLQPLGDALHLQHLSSQHRLPAGGPRRDEERRPSLIGWLLCRHTRTIQRSTLTSYEPAALCGSHSS